MTVKTIGGMGHCGVAGAPGGDWNREVSNVTVLRWKATENI